MAEKGGTPSAWPTAARGQSEVVGVLLLTAVVVLAVGTAGAFYLTSIGDDHEKTRLTVRGDVTGQNVTLVHAGGETVATANLRVRVRVNDSARAVGWADGATDLDTPGEFGPGDRWTVNVSRVDGAPLSSASVVDVGLYDTETGTRLYVAQLSPE